MYDNRLNKCIFFSYYPPHFIPVKSSCTFCAESGNPLIVYHGKLWMVQSYFLLLLCFCREVSELVEAIRMKDAEAETYISEMEVSDA